MPIKGNKGEWSEFYAFIKILADKYLHAADEDLNVLEQVFYPVYKIIREEAAAGKIEFDIKADTDNIKITDSSNNIMLVHVTDLDKKAKKLFSVIKNSDKRTFSIPLGAELMEKLKCTQIKANSGRKSDIKLLIHDFRYEQDTEVGFSIKSLVGSPATLLNASGSTNFVYRVENISDVDVKAINNIKTRSKIKDRLQAIITRHGKLSFTSLTSDIFEHNLRNIDTILPEILSNLLLANFMGHGSLLTELTEYLGANVNELRGFSLDETGYKIKLKNFLHNIALGMMPNTEWDGLLQVHGGYIIVKENGEIVCYHIFNQDEFQNYLFKNTRLDTPSTTRHGFGEIYKEGENYFIKLNLQIRFNH
ncbi:MAG: HpaII family restriction endonuclease [Patescibacteria group bacterium]